MGALVKQSQKWTPRGKFKGVQPSRSIKLPENGRSIWRAWWEGRKPRLTFTELGRTQVRPFSLLEQRKTSKSVGNIQAINTENSNDLQGVMARFMPERSFAKG